jgi:uncharacterized membrane protein
MKDGMFKVPTVPAVPVDRDTLEELAAAGLIHGASLQEALRLLNPARRWWHWIQRMLLVLGAALFLAGMIFFFAYNWAAMAAWQKFGILELAVLACVVAAWLLGLGTLPGKMALFAGSLLVGLLLAVYGQVYQTGADAWELFMGWSLLILAWVVLGRFAAQWILWLGLVNLCLILYWDQVAIPNQKATAGLLCIVLGALDTLALVAREYGINRRMGWLDGNWIRPLLLAAALIDLSIPALSFITEPGERTGVNAVGTLLLLALIAGAYRHFRVRRRDLFALFLCALCLSVVVLTLCGKVMFEVSDTFFMYLLFGLLVVAVASSAAWWLWAVGKTWKGGENHD